jgi:hypothetical protein
MKNSGNIMEQQKGKIYLKLPCSVKVAGVLVRVHQLGLQKPRHGQRIKYFSRTHCVETLYHSSTTHLDLGRGGVTTELQDVVVPRST